MSKEDVQSLHQSIAKNLLPRSYEIHTHIKDFLSEEIQGTSLLIKILTTSILKTIRFLTDWRTSTNSTIEMFWIWKINLEKIPSLFKEETGICLSI